MWPGHQVQSALAPAGFPRSRPPSGRATLPTCVYSSATAMGERALAVQAPRWAGSGSGPATLRPGAGSWKRAPHQSALGHLAEKFFSGPQTFPRAGGRGAEKARIGLSRPSLASPRRDWLGRGRGRERPSSRQVVKWVHLAGTELFSKNQPSGTRWLSRAGNG